MGGVLFPYCYFVRGCRGSIGTEIRVLECGFDVLLLYTDGEERSKRPKQSSVVKDEMLAGLNPCATADDIVQRTRASSLIEGRTIKSSHRASIS